MRNVRFPQYRHLEESFVARDGQKPVLVTSDSTKIIHRSSRIFPLNTTFSKMERHSTLGKVAFGSSKTSPPDGSSKPPPRLRLRNSAYLINDPPVLLVASFSLPRWLLFDRARETRTRLSKERFLNERAGPTIEWLGVRENCCSEIEWVVEPSIREPRERKSSNGEKRNDAGRSRIRKKSVEEKRTRFIGTESGKL